MSEREECWRLVYSWLSIRECLCLRQAAHCMDFLTEDEVFAELAQEQIAPVQLSGTAAILTEDKRSAWVLLCKELLDIPSFKGLVQAFSRFSLPLVGYWSKIPEDIRSDGQGQLLRIRPSHDYSLVAECLSPTGAVSLRFTLRVALDPFRHTHYFRAEGPVGALHVKQTEDFLVISATFSSIQYAPVSLVSVPDPALTDPWIAPVRALSGFVIGPYGGHGLEILTVQLSAPGTRPYHHNDCSIGHPRLEGLKIVGDQNVPAGKLSFLVDLSKAYDPQEMFEDERPTVAFSPMGAHLVDRAARRNKILFWFRGKGQINRVPRIWAPSWVGLDFIVYREECQCELGGVLFSVLWDDDNEPVRHNIDFKRFDDLIEPAWVMPPTLSMEDMLNEDDTFAT